MFLFFVFYSSIGWISYKADVVIGGQYGGKNVTGPESSRVLQGIGVNTCQEVSSELWGVKGPWPSLHISITMGTHKNKLKHNFPSKYPDAQFSVGPIKISGIGLLVRMLRNCNLHSLMAVM